MYRALHALHDGLPWQKWPEPLANRDESTLKQSRAALNMEISYRRYLQWLASEQWSEGTATCAARFDTAFGRVRPLPGVSVTPTDVAAAFD